MSGCDARDGVGIVQGRLRGAWPAARRAVAAMLAVGLVALSVPSVGAWDAGKLLRAAAAHDAHAVQISSDLKDLLASLARTDTPTRLDAINKFFNRAIEFAEDPEVWGQIDYWASPVETLAKGSGDCEDYAIAKYFALTATGVPVASLRLVYVRAMLAAGGGLPARSQAHMVLAYYADQGDDPLILDNLVADIRHASRRSDLTPVFSFNSEGLWQGAGTQTAGDPMARLSRWRDVLRKARAEGFE
jgi:predicted transglutaminase-like cysteine proteinase